MSKALCPPQALKKRKEGGREEGRDGRRKEGRKKKGIKERRKEGRDRQADRQPVGGKACGGSGRTHRLRAREQSRIRKES